MASIAITGANGRLGRALRADPRWRDNALQPCLRTADAELGAISVESLADPGVMGRFDAVLHLAWGVVPTTAEANPRQVHEIELPLLDRLSKSATEAQTHLLFVSTGAVYGNSERETGSIETDELNPVGEYARGKAAAETLIQERNEQAAILRVANVYGVPGTAGPPQGVIPRIIQAALEGTVFEQWGVDSEKDYIHIDDLSRALLATIDQRISGIYNVCSGRTLRLSEMIALVENLTNRRIEVRAKEGELSWDVTRNRLDPSKFTAASGWKPEVELEDGVSRLVQEIGASA
tara:strand:- start:2415 stop:3290 length:876 start_codon:yes stop_codon:yes gene_type:complete